MRDLMGLYSTVILVTAALFAALVLQLAASPKFTAKLTGICVAVAAVGGLLFYGYGFAVVLDNGILSVARALIAVCDMFLGGMAFEEIETVPLLQNAWVQALFWLVHLAALYATASAAIGAIGAGALRKLRLWLGRGGDLNIIFGVSGESVSFGGKLLEQKRGQVVFVDRSSDAGEGAAVEQIGCVLRTDESALRANERFMRSVGIRKTRPTKLAAALEKKFPPRKITLYALREDYGDDLSYAGMLLDTCRKLGISRKRLSLVILGEESRVLRALRQNETSYGYVTIFRPETLAARLLTKTYPPCDAMDFHKDGRAAGSFEVLLIGFGHLGQEVLRNLVMNGQFVGSRFRATVFDPHWEESSGYFRGTCGAFLENYHIEFKPYDGRSGELYDFISRRADKLRYVAVCAGSTKSNREIARELSGCFERLGVELPVYQCTYSDVTATFPNGGPERRHTVYDPELLCTDTLDRMAMFINKQYQNGLAMVRGAEERSKELEEAVDFWMDCGYFDRMSNRAAADFMPAFLRAAGRTAGEAVREDGWKLDAALEDNLGNMEHMRWCAFYYAMGYRAMSREEFQTRADAYEAEKKKDPRYRITRNDADRTHACLIPWEELDDLSRRENSVTGGKRNYRRNDLDNVYLLPKLLRAAGETQ